MAHDIFISYPREDHATAAIVCSALEAAGISCWIAPRDIPVGTDYAEALLDAILASRLVVLVFSSHANHSSHIVREVERAANSNIRILPMRIEDVPYNKGLEYFLSGVQHFDAFGPSVGSYLTDFVEAIARQLAKPLPASFKRPRRAYKWKQAAIIAGALLVLGMLWLSWKAYYWIAAQMAFAEGNAAGQAQRPADAVAKFSEAIKLNPRLGRAYANRSYACAQLRQFESALEDITTAIRLEPGIAQDLYARATIHGYFQNHQAVIRDLSEAIRLAPLPDYYYFRSQAYYNANEYRKAVTDLTEYLRLTPRAYAYYSRGLVYNRLGEYQHALTDLDTAITMDTNNPDAYKERSLTQAKLGKQDVAARDRQQAIHLYKILHDNLQSIGNHAAAEEALKQARELQSHNTASQSPAHRQ